ALYVADGVPAFYYNFFDRFTGEARAAARLTPGPREVQLRFEYDGRIAAGATLRLVVDDQQVGEGRIDATAPAMFSMNETMDVGRSRGSAVSGEYSGAFPFVGARCITCGWTSSGGPTCRGSAARRSTWPPTSPAPSPFRPL